MTCSPSEFKCVNTSQCIPYVFHCDGEQDCIDGSDESAESCVSNVQCKPGMFPYINKVYLETLFRLIIFSIFCKLLFRRPLKGS